MPDETTTPAKPKGDVIVDVTTGEEVAREAQKGQTLQPSPNFVSDDSDKVRNFEAHAYSREAKAIVAEVAKARGITEEEAKKALVAEGNSTLKLAAEEEEYHKNKPE